MKRRRLTKSERFSLRELAERAGVPPRTLRFYIARGLLPGPTRRGRYADYGVEHLRCLQRIQELQAKGYTLGQIAQVLAGSSVRTSALPESVVWRHYPVAEDVVVMVREPSSPWRIQRIRSAVAKLVTDLNGESSTQKESRI